MFEQVWASYRLAAETVTPADVQNFKALHEQGGFVHHPLGYPIPTSGYMVGISNQHGGVAHAIPGESLTPHHLAEHRHEAAHLFHDPNVFQGGWMDKGKAYLDTAKRYQDKNEAIHAGKHHNQIAIYDIGKGEEIPTGGTGAV